ncbi:MAG TPA: extracellular solute-binding protein [Thermoanaerobaculia bacterium]|jgi:arabinogalactan oligomer/maltooligosaccharide transport system substrate-binding protein
MKKILLALAILLLPTSAFAQTELVVWHAYRGGEKTAFEKVVNTYNASQKKIKVSPLAVPYDAFADKITAAVPRGKGPDLFIYAQDRLGGWVAAGNTIEPIDFYLDKATTARFIPSTMQAMTYRKTTYGLPLNYKVMTMIYNKALVKTPPKTTAELVKVAKANTNAAAGRFGLVYWYSNWYYHAPLFNGFGGGVFDAAGKPIVNSAANAKSLDLLLKWANKDKILPKEPSTALITSLFNEGKAAIVFSGPWFLEEVSPKIQYGLALLPTIDEAGNKPMKPWMTVEGVFIAAPSKKKDAAYEFARYLTDVPATKVLALEGSQSPANRNVYNDPQVAANGVLKAFRAQVDRAVPMPNVPEMTMMWSPVTTAMNEIVQNASTPKAALDKAQKDVVGTIAKLKK